MGTLKASQNKESFFFYKSHEIFLFAWKFICNVLLISDNIMQITND